MITLAKTTELQAAVPVQALLADKPMPQLICEKQQRTGPRFATKVCLTDDEVARRRVTAVPAAAGAGAINQPRANPAGKD